MKKLVILMSFCSFSAFAQELEKPTVSHQSGFYTDEFQLTISHTDPTVTILYTLDGSEPKIENLAGKEWNYKTEYPRNPGDAFGSLLKDTIWTYTYDQPLTIVDRTAESSKTAHIPTSIQYPEYDTLVQTEDIFKGTTIRVVAYLNGNYGEVVTLNYFISPKGQTRYSFPVIAISTDNDKLFDYEKGIMVVGKEFDDWRTANPSEEYDAPAPANYRLGGDVTETPINFSYFVNGTETLNHGAGLRMNGGWTRVFPNKSLRFYAKNGYGAKEFKSAFFENYSHDKFKRLIAHNGGNDAIVTIFRDAMTHDLSRNLHVDIQESLPVIVFINSEYNGIRNLRERYDSKYFERIYNVDEDELDFIENYWEVKDGDLNFLQQTQTFFENNSLIDDEKYQEAITYIDPINYTDYLITNMYVANTDWPHNNNLFWRKKTNYNTNTQHGHDGRFRWLLKDLDFGFDIRREESYKIDMIDRITSIDGGLSIYTLFQRKLLENENYKIHFLNRMADVLNTTFEKDRVTSFIQKYENTYTSEIAENSNRFLGYSKTLSHWQWYLSYMYEFAEERHSYMYQHVQNKFGIDTTYNLSLNVSDTAHGYLHLNTIDILSSTDGINETAYPWNGIYFSNIPIELKAVAKAGYEFSHWSGDIETDTSANIVVSFYENTNIKANFIPAVRVVAGNLTAPSELCANTNFTITSDEIADNGVSIQWESSPTGINNWTAIPNAQAMSYTPSGITESTDFRLILSYSDVNLSLADTSNTITIITYESFGMGEINVANKENCTFDFEIENTQGVNTFVWNFGTENITTATPNVSYTFTDAIKYQVIVKGIGYCGSKSTAIIVDCSELNVLENTPENTIRVFPNPANDYLSVLSDAPNLAYAIFSSDGREILNGVLNGITIDIKSIEAGRYILRLEKDGYHHFKHFIKQ